MTHQRVEDVRKHSVDKSVFLIQNTPHVNVLVHQESVRTHVVELHSRVKDTVPPVEVVKQVKRGWNARAKVGEKMRDHDYIGLSPDNTLCPMDIRVDDPFSQKWVLDVVQIHRAKYCNLEVIRLWVVQSLQIGNGLLFTILCVCCTLVKFGMVQCCL